MLLDTAAEKSTTELFPSSAMPREHIRRQCKVSMHSTIHQDISRLCIHAKPMINRPVGEH